MGDLSELVDRTGSPLWVPAAHGGLYELEQVPDPQADAARVLRSLLGRGERLLITAKPVVAKHAAVLIGDKPEPFPVSSQVLLASLDQLQCLGLPPAPVRKHDRGARGQVATGGLDNCVRLRGQ